jgi:RNA polymerase sigma factor (TIGR02999 family)
MDHEADRGDIRLQDEKAPTWLPAHVHYLNGLLGAVQTAYPHAVSDVTRLLDAVERGEPKAAEELLPLVYEELRRLAAAKMAGEKPGHTLQPTALVHEAWVRLLGPEGEQQSWEGRGHFFAAAADAMRRILIDRARRKSRVRHGGKLTRVDLATIDLAAQSGDDTLLRVDEAVDKLATEHPLKAQLVKLRYFAGLSIPEACRVLGLSLTTGKRHWAYARAWLYEELTRDT